MAQKEITSSQKLIEDVDSLLYNYEVIEYFQKKIYDTLDKVTIGNHEIEIAGNREIIREAFKEWI